MADPEFHVERIDRPDGRSELRFSGRMRFREMQPVWSDVRAHVGRCGQTVDLDLSGVPAADGGAIALLLELKNELVERGARVEIVGAQGGVRAMLQLYGEHAARPAHKPPPPRIGILDQIGREALRIFGEARALDFLGDLTTAVGASLRAPRSVRWRDIVRLMERAGADGLPIVLLINFLVGLVTISGDDGSALARAMGVALEQITGEIADEVRARLAAAESVKPSVKSSDAH